MRLRMNVIVICPCCASPVDAQSHDDEQDLHCTACGQLWSMVVNAARQREYALT